VEIRCKSFGIFVDAGAWILLRLLASGFFAPLSPFPTIPHLISLRAIAIRRSGKKAFHKFTALITTTRVDCSFLIPKATALVVFVSSVDFSAGFAAYRKSTERDISTAIGCAADFSAAQKASKVAVGGVSSPGKVLVK
jgi:hypothetical protein